MHFKYVLDCKLHVYYLDLKAKIKGVLVFYPENDHDKLTNNKILLGIVFTLGFAKKASWAPQLQNFRVLHNL